MTIPNYPSENNSYDEPAGGGLPSYDTTAATTPYGDATDGLIHDKKNYLELSALLAGGFSIPAIFLAVIPGIILSIVAVIAGIIALIQRKKYAPENHRTWMPVVGLVCGLITLIIAVILTAVILSVSAAHPECLQQGSNEAMTQCILENLG